MYLVWRVFARLLVCGQFVLGLSPSVQWANGAGILGLAVFSTFPSDILSFALLIFPGLHMHTSPWSVLLQVC